MYENKDIDFGFVILCPERNMGGFRLTSRTISNYQNRPQICITGNDATAKEVKEMKALCPTYKGKDTITSLINAGLKKSTTDWTCFIFAGAFVKASIYKNYINFIEDEKDILFPIANNKTDFIDCSLNGLFIHKKAFKEIGPLDEKNPLHMCRLFWALDATDLGYRFKAIMGAKIV